MSKPRQFWIKKSSIHDGYSAIDASAEGFIQGYSEIIKCIEDTAYILAIDELKAAKEALETCFMQFADLSARVKAPDVYMLTDCQEAMIRIDKFLKENE